MVITIVVLYFTNTPKHLPFPAPQSNAGPAMNTSPNAFRFQARPNAAAQNATSSRPARRERDFGVGYGSSSGYASPRRYVTGSTQRLFRFA